jgi:hypothetical protein
MRKGGGTPSLFPYLMGVFGEIVGVTIIGRTKLFGSVD